MAARFISVTLDDFEKLFNVPSKKNPEIRAFNLIREQYAEAYYKCVLRDTKAGKLAIKVYTSVRSDRNKARDVGEDAIRIVTIWIDNSGWEKPVGQKSKRIHRSGGANSTAETVVERAFNRAKEIASQAMKLNICSCGRPMVTRQGKGAEFLGCIGYSKKLCSNTKNIT